MRRSIVDMKILVFISRLIVGSLFIVSGLIKANDPTGFSYKLEDYFAPDVLGMEWMIPFALSLAVVISVIEIIIGVSIILGTKMRSTSNLLLGMILFFTFLTFYSAYFDKVTDCGCFGDALKLTPWQSFYKDLVLLVLTLIIWINRNSISINSDKENKTLIALSIITTSSFSVLVINWVFPIVFSAIIFIVIVLLKKTPFFRNNYSISSMAITGIACMLFVAHVMNHLPIRDFRPYAIGKNINEGMKTCDELDLKCPEYQVVYTLEKKSSEEIIKMTSQDYIDEKIWEDTNYVLIADETESILIDKGYTPPIHDFSITSYEGEDFTQPILEEKGYTFLVIAYDLTNSNNIEASKHINEIASDAEQAGYNIIGLTSSTYEATDEFRHNVQAMYNYYTTDEKTLKTIIRSNPGMVLIKEGIIINKWHYKDLPSASQLIDKEKSILIKS